MDPDACLERLLEAYGANDADEVIEAIDDLIEWLSNDGVMPNIKPGDFIALLQCLRDCF